MQTHVFVQNAGTVGTPATFGNPGLVTEGVIAAFNAKTGAGIDMSGALGAGVEAFLVLGDDNQPVLTAPFNKDNILVEKKAYEAPVKQVSVITIPAGPSGGSDYNIKVRVVRALSGTERTVDGAEPFPTTNFEVSVAAAQGAEDTINAFITAINRTDVQYPFEAKSNKVQTVTLTGTGGTANITIDGVAYLATFNSDLDTTAADFVSTHGASILASHGYTVSTTANDDVIFTQTKGNAGDPTIANASGDLAGSVADTQAATTLSIVAKDYRTVFTTAHDGFTGSFTVTPMSEGSGYGEFVRELEARTRGTYGNYYQDTGLLGSLGSAPEVRASSTGAYTIYVVRAPNDNDDSINRSFKYSEIVLAISSAVSGDFDTFFGV